MPFPVPPNHLQRILDRPGRDWSLDERNDVVVWLNARPQIGFLVRIAAVQLGRLATAQDAEDAWQEYCVKVLLRTLTPRFDPALSPFQAYLLLSLKQFCRRRGLVLGRARDRELPLERQIGGEMIEIDPADSSGRPDEALERAEDERDEERKRRERAQRHRRLRRCVDALLERYRTVIVRYYLDNETLVAIAESLHLNESTVRVRAYRARHQLKRCLEMPAAKRERPSTRGPAESAGSNVNGQSKRRTSR